MANRIYNGITIDEAREVVNEWLDFYNKKRPHWSLNGLTPYEKFYGVRLAKSA